MTTGIALPDVRIAMIKAVENDTEIMAMLAGDGIYDNTPDDAPFPYIVAGEVTELPNDIAHSALGGEMTDTWHFWSTDAGKLEVMRLMQRADEVLARRPLAITGHMLVGLTREFSQVFTERSVEPVVVYQHGVIRWRIRTVAA